jgi:ankyrin repeat protein
VEKLLGEGASPSVQDGDGGTPLHDASAGGYDGIVRMLLAAATARGAEVLKGCVDAQDGDGEVPLHLAARGEHAGVVQQLLAAGARVDIKSEVGLYKLNAVDP